MRIRPTVTTPAAQRIRDILRDPPRAGWSRRTFLSTMAAAAVVPLLTDTPAWARAQHSAGRIKIALTKDGYFDLPAAPGLGVTIRKDLYEK